MISLFGVTIAKIEKLEKEHLRVARLVHKISKERHDRDVLQIVKWMLISYMYKRSGISFTYKAYHNQCPAEINSIITKKQNHPNLRDNLKIDITRPKTEHREKAFKHRAAILWNALPENLKKILN